MISVLLICLALTTVAAEKCQCTDGVYCSGSLTVNAAGASCSGKCLCRLNLGSSKTIQIASGESFGYYVQVPPKKGVRVIHTWDSSFDTAVIGRFIDDIGDGGGGSGGTASNYKFSIYERYCTDGAKDATGNWYIHGVGGSAGNTVTITVDDQFIDSAENGCPCNGFQCLADWMSTYPDTKTFPAIRCSASGSTCACSPGFTGSTCSEAQQPTRRPTKYPTRRPTKYPTRPPVDYPTERPTRQPTERPTRQPTERPTRQPSNTPSTEDTTYSLAFPRTTATACILLAVFSLLLCM